MSKKNTLLVTGGAGLDDYSSGFKINHIKNSRLRYIKGKTTNVNLLIKNPSRIKSIFHFGEFARIYQSFLKMNECIESNSVGSNAVFNFCLKHKIKLIYSATSATLGNKGNDKNLSPYAFTKSKNLELLENLKKWFNFKYEVIYFYNVYGPHQICRGEMSTVIGIFEDHFKKDKPLPVVKPGTQTRRFTHIDDTVKICFLAWKKNLCRHYSISNKKSYSIIEVAKMFSSKLKFLPKRPGERYASALKNENLSNKMYKHFGKINLKDYIKEFLKNN